MAVQELRIWNKVLANLSLSPIDLYESALEALMLRGILEAPALLSINAVVDGQSEPTDNVVKQLHVSVYSVDFRILPVDQVEVIAFTIEGGPGYITSESDHLSVTPIHFNAETTQIRVEAKSLSATAMWTELTLSTSMESVKIPVVAQWETVKAPAAITPSEPAKAPAMVKPSAPLPLPVNDSAKSKRDSQTKDGKHCKQDGFPLPSESTSKNKQRSLSSPLIVDPSGNGDFLTLEEAVLKSQPRTVLRLVAGQHYLKAPLLIKKDLTLIGEGMESTQIVCHSEKYVVTFSGNGKFSTSEVTFAHEGEKWADVVHGIDGEITFDRCRFTGGVKEHHGNQGGNGLHLSGAAKGQVMFCEMINNDWAGIYIGGQACPLLECNQCRENKRFGIIYCEHAAGKAQNNVCVDNWRNLFVRDKAKPDIVN